MLAGIIAGRRFRCKLINTTLVGCYELASLAPDFQAQSVHFRVNKIILKSWRKNETCKDMITGLTLYPSKAHQTCLSLTLFLLKPFTLNPFTSPLKPSGHPNQI